MFEIKGVNFIGEQRCGNSVWAVIIVFNLFINQENPQISESI